MACKQIKVTDLSCDSLMKHNELKKIGNILNTTGDQCLHFSVQCNICNGYICKYSGINKSTALLKYNK